MVGGCDRLKTADAIIELNSSLADVSDYRDLHTVLETVLKNYFHIDWLAVYSAINGKIDNAVTGDALPFNWGVLYKEIEDYDNLRRHVLSMTPGDVVIHDEVCSHDNEIDRFCMDYAARHTDARQYMCMPLIMNAGSAITLGIYRTEKRDFFLTEDKELLRRLSPLLISCANSLLLYHEFGSKRTAFEQLVKAENLKYAILDELLFFIELPEATLHFLRRAYNRPNLQGLPPSIHNWIHTIIAPEGRLKRNTGPWTLKQELSSGRLDCRAHVVLDDRKTPVLLLKFDMHGETVDFGILQKAGFTLRETDVLSFLPLGYSNKQIADAMGITASGVKKHLKNIAAKTGAERKTEILFQAIKLKKEMEYLEASAVL